MGTRQCIWNESSEWSDHPPSVLISLEHSEEVGPEHHWSPHSCQEHLSIFFQKKNFSNLGDYCLLKEREGHAQRRVN